MLAMFSPTVSATERTISAFTQRSNRRVAGVSALCLALVALLTLATGTPLAAQSVRELRAQRALQARSGAQPEPEIAPVEKPAATVVGEQRLDFGPMKVGETSEAKEVTFTFNRLATLGKIDVVTMGARNLEFKNANTGTCEESRTYEPGQSCSVDVTLTPRFPGERKGAVVLKDEDGAELAVHPLIDNVSGAQLIFLPGSTSTLSTTGYTDPEGAAVDASGNVYVVDALNNALYKLAAGTFAKTTVSTSLDSPYGVAVDSSGNVYTANAGFGGHPGVDKFTGGTGSPTAVGSGWTSPNGVAVDSSGNVYVADYGGGLFKVVGSTKTQIGTGATGSGANNYAVAVDSSGNVYVSTIITLETQSTVFKETFVSGTTYTQSTVSTAFNTATGIVVTPHGDLIISDDNALSSPGAVYKYTLSGSSYTASTLSGISVDFPESVALDGLGNLYMANDLDSGDGGHGYTASGVYEQVFAAAPSMAFGSVAYGSTSAAQTASLDNIGNAGLTYTDSLASLPTGYILGGGNTCADTALASGASCTLAIEFQPTVGGNTAENGDVVLTGTQEIALTGTGTGVAGVAPTITSTAGTVFTVGTSGSFTVTASGTPAPTFSETGALPSGVTFSGGVLSGTPAAGTGGTYSLTITASNGTLPNATQSFALTVHQAPAVTSANSTTFISGTAGSFTATASGYPTPTFSETGVLPTGVTFTSGGVLSGTPSGTPGTYPLTITASNGVGSNATQSFTLTVDQAPAVTSANNTTFTVGSSGSFTATASGYPAPTFSETGALPSGVTFTSGGVLSGTPAAGTGGVYTLTITASNGVSPNATQTFTLTVDQAPGITSGTSTTFTSGTANSFTATASGYPTPTFSETGVLPTGVTFTSGGVLSGTPSGAPGSYPLTITASNGVGSPATQSFTLTVDQAPSITSASDTTFTVGSSGSFTTTATGYPAPTFSETGALPSGVTFTSGGVLSGTPAAGTGGTYSLTITASNGVSPNGTQSFTLTVDQAPAITSASGTAFTIGSTGSFTATASGYPAPTFSETGIMPSGVTFTSGGVLSGSPTGVSGTYPITITASNGIGSPATQSFTLTVNPGAATHLVIPGGPEPFDTGFSFNIYAYDAYGNLATSYNGTVAFTSSDPGFVNLGPITLVNGVGTQSAALKTAGVDTITATDTSNSSITGTGSFTIQPGAATHFGVAVPSTTYAGSPFSFTVTAYDLFGNVATGYTGTATFSSTDVAASLPSPATLTNGFGTFSATLNTAGSQTITATDAANSVAGTSAAITVTIPGFVVNLTGDDAGTASNCAVQPSAGTTTNSDSCSLRDALAAAAAQGSGSISFDSSVFGTATSIALTNGALAIPANTSIWGATSGSGGTLTDLVTVNGNSASTDFTVASGVTGAGINNLIITGGISINGGGIYNQGTLTVAGSTISGNSSSSGFGGGIANLGTLTLTGSTLSGNSAANGQGGGIFNSGTLTATNNTISGNSAAGGIGGGIFNVVGSMTLTANTISGNASTGGGGIYISPGTTVTLANNIVTGNAADADIDGTYTDNGGNQITTGVALATLGNYGGPTQTQLPLPGDPSICGGLAANIPVGLTTDQRGYPRSNVYGATTCYDSGAAQTAYSIVFSTGVTSPVSASVPFSPAPAVQLTENSNIFLPAAGPIVMTDSSSALGGTTSASTASGYATFSNLTVGSVVSGDMLTATLTLSSGVQITAISNTFSSIKQAQTITFPAITEPVYVGGTVTLSATASSGLAVSYVSVYPNAGICTVTNTGGVWTVNLLAQGGCSIEAQQWGNSAYGMAPFAFQNFYVHSSAQTISFPAISTPVYAGNSVSLSATATSGLAVSFASTTPTICTVSESGSAWSAHLLIGGRCTITATQSGGPSGGLVYAPATAVSQTFTVTRLAQTITFPAIPGPVYAGGTVTPAATASSGLPVSYSAVYPAICTVSNTGGVWTINLLTVGECSVEAQQGGSTTYAGAPFAFANFYVHPTP
jgi:hypothetical protein